MAQVVREETPIKELAREAMNLRNAYSFAEAVPVWQKLVSTDGKNAVWKLRLVESSARAGSVETARAAAATLGKEAGKHTKILISTANALVNARCHEDAERLLGYLNETEMDNPDRHFALARICQRTGRLAQAIELFQACIARGDSRGRAAKVMDKLAMPRPTTRAKADVEDFPDFRPAASRPLTGVNETALPDAETAVAIKELLARGGVLIGEADYSGARAVLQRVLARDPANIEARLLQARVFDQMGDRATAQTWLRGVLTMDPDCHIARRDLARSLQASELWEEARSHWCIFADVNAAEPEPRLQIARCYFHSRQFAQAAAAYAAALEIKPDNEDCLVGYARSLAAFGDAKAGHAWLNVARHNINNLEAVTAVIAASEQPDLREHAEALLNEHLASGGRVPNLVLALARSHIAKGAFAAAEELLSDLLQFIPEAVGPLVELGRLYQRRSQWAQASATWQKVLRVQPERLEALRGLTHALAKTGAPAAAIELWRERAQIAPLLGEPHMRMARLHVQMGEREQAEACLLKALELEPDNGDLIGEMVGFLAADSSRRLEALELSARWLELEPKAARPHLRRSQLFVQLGQLAQAETELSLAQRVAPDDPAAGRAYVQFLIRGSRFEEALAPLDRWIALSPGTVEPQLAKADIMVRLSRNDEAEAIYRALLDNHPDNEQALNGVARICRSLRRIDEAVAIWRRAVAVNPGNADAWIGIVTSLANADREAEALAEFERAQAALGLGAEARLNYAIMMDAGRFSDRAGDAYRRAIEAAPDDLRVRRRFGTFLRREGNMDGALAQLSAAREFDPNAIDLALELIDVIEGLEYVGTDAWTLTRQKPPGGAIMFPELLFRRLHDIADREVETYEAVPGRVILINQSLAAGGAERQLVTTLRGLASSARSDNAAGRLESVTLFCTSLDPSTGRNFYLPHVVESGIEIVLPDEAGLTSAREDEAVQAHAMLLSQLPEEFAVVRFWLAEFRRRKPQIVHAWQDMTCLTAVVAALLAGVPKIILNTRSVRPDNPRRRLRRWMRSAYGDVLRHPRVEMVSNSRAGADDYADWIGLDPKAIKVVHNGIDFDGLAGQADPRASLAIRARLGIPPGAPVIGGVFRMSEEKRPLLFVQTAGVVASQLPDVHVVVCGEGPMAPEMRELAGQLGFSGRLHMPGNQNNISDWFGLMDVVLLTSRHEGLPNVLIEAQSFGIPVVVPAVGGAPEVVLQGKTGFAVPNADPQSLAERIVHCLKNKRWRAGARKLAPKFVRDNFSIRAMIEATLAVYGLR